ncbi:unnamed protein product, partial [Ectocarpus fasciculatus]
PARSHPHDAHKRRPPPASGCPAECDTRHSSTALPRIDSACVPPGIPPAWGVPTLSVFSKGTGDRGEESGGGAVIELAASVLAAAAAAAAAPPPPPVAPPVANAAAAAAPVSDVSASVLAVVASSGF